MIQIIKSKSIMFLAYMDQGTQEIKLTLSLFVASITTGLMSVFRWMSSETLNYLATERSFIALIVIFVVCDSATGTWKNWKFKTLNISKFIYGTLTKFVVSMIFAIMFHGMVYIMNNGPGNSMVGDYILITGRLLVSIYIVSSAVSNIYIITDGKFPPKILMSRFDKYNETLDISVLTGTKDMEINNP